jgi:hypothetical protein
MHDGVITYPFAKGSFDPLEWFSSVRFGHDRLDIRESLQIAGNRCESIWGKNAAVSEALKHIIWNPLWQYQLTDIMDHNG